MGMFKDIHAVQRQAKEMRKKASPGAEPRFAQMNQQMGALTSSLETSTAALAPPSPDSVPAEAQVLSVDPATGYLNGDPIVMVSVLLHQGKERRPFPPPGRSPCRPRRCIACNPALALRPASTRKTSWRSPSIGPTSPRPQRSRLGRPPVTRGSPRRGGRAKVDHQPGGRSLASRSASSVEGQPV